MRLYDYIDTKTARKLLKFAIVGIIGSSINLVVFYIIVDVHNVSYNYGAIIAFSLSVTSNYFFNHSWTFCEENAGVSYKLSYYFKYVATNLIGLSINIIALNLTITVFNPSPRVIAQLLGIVAGASFDFIISKRFVFKCGVGNIQRNPTGGSS